MQIWIYFDPGCGGDGIANLLEHADNVVPLDGRLMWRIHHYVDGQPKFWAPTVDQQGCFRKKFPFKQDNNQLLPSYLQAIDNARTVICTSHDVSLDQVYQSDCIPIFFKNHRRILIRNINPRQAFKINCIKNLKEYIPYQPKPSVTMTDDAYDFILDEEKFKTDWNYVTNFCQTIGLTLDQKFYHEYQQILNNTVVIDSTIEHYESNINGDIVSYRKL